jgi:hypothetical protein
MRGTRKITNTTLPEASLRLRSVTTPSTTIGDALAFAVPERSRRRVRPALRDFQEINYPSCGVGDTRALYLGRARCPSHKKIWDVFLFGSPLRAVQVPSAQFNFLLLAQFLEMLKNSY